MRLPRHLRNKHDYSESEARYALINTNQRLETHRLAVTKRKDYHKRVKCPVPQCFANVMRLPRHLKTHHKNLTKDQVIDCLVKSSSNPDANFSSSEDSSASEFEPDSNMEDFADADGAITFSSLKQRFRLYLARKNLDTKTINQHLLHLRKMHIANDAKSYRNLFDISLLHCILDDFGIGYQTKRHYITTLHHLLSFFKAHPNLDPFFSNTQIG